MDNVEATQNLPVGVKTVAASASAGLFRIFLMPVDTVKVRSFASFPTEVGVHSGCTGVHDGRIQNLTVVRCIQSFPNTDDHASYG
jgi:hypothetical protein